MSRRRKPTTITIENRGVSISFYPNARGTWEASFTIPGRKRDKAFGSTEAECREVAFQKIRDELGADQYADKSDEDAARRILKDHGVSLVESARYWVAEHSKPLENRTVREVRDLWLAHRKGIKAKKGYHYARSLASRSRHIFAKFGDRLIASLTMHELVLWQDEIEQVFEPRGARNIHDATKGLFKFARKRSFLDPERLSAMERLDRPKAGPAGKKIHTPEVMQILLDTAWGYALPGAIPMAATAFGSLRAEELCRQDPDAPLEDRVCWEDVFWREKFIWVRDEADKNSQGRRAGMPNNLIEMLRPRKDKGPLYSGSRLDLAYQEIAKKAGVEWMHNALRHSCLTYLMLLAANATEGATGAGNSVAIIEARYRNRRATKAEARKWFKLKPRVAWGSALRSKPAAK
jgi:hypothetical protein